MHPRASLAILTFVASPLTAQAEWVRVYPPSAPSARWGCASTFDSVRGRALVFGGQIQSPTDQLCLWDGTSWSVAAPAVRPPARIDGAMAFDESRGRAVLWGGTGANTYNDTWEWNGSSWTLVASGVPPARYAHAMAYDPLRHAVLMFGGWDTVQNHPLNDLWQWDGVTWQQRSSGGPSPRSYTSLSFDPNRGEMLLFGGGDSVGNLDDTWTWNGQSWQQLFPTSPPYPRQGHSTVTDLARRRVVLIGGTPLPDPFAWEWDGNDWHQQLISSPAARYRSAAAYDSVRHETVLFGGAMTITYQSLLADTWIHGTSQPASFAPYGQGCPGSAGTPALTTAPYSLPWLGDTFRTQLGPIAAASGGAVFVTGIASTPGQSLGAFGFTGCQSFVTLDSAQFAVPSAGVAQWSLAIPANMALAGVAIYQQGFVFDPAAPGGAVVSNAATITAGVR
jgi:hypothetical protein